MGSEFETIFFLHNWEIIVDRKEWVISMFEPAAIFFYVTFSLNRQTHGKSENGTGYKTLIPKHSPTQKEIKQWSIFSAK